MKKKKKKGLTLAYPRQLLANGHLITQKKKNSQWSISDRSIDNKDINLKVG